MQGGWADVDGELEYYSKYAGPVYVSAPGNTCVDFYGGFYYGLTEPMIHADGGATGVRC